MIKERSTEHLLYQSYLFLILFAYTDGFGLRGDGMWGGLGNESLGPFGLMQFALFATSIYFMIISYGSLFKPRSNASNATKWFLVLFVIIMIQLFFQSLGDTSKLAKFTNLIKLKGWLLLFSIPVLYNHLPVKKVINVIKLSGFISSAIVIIVLILGIQGTAIEVKVGMSATHALRVMIPTGPLITFAFFLFLASWQQSRSIFDIIGILLCFMGTFIQLHRSSTLAILLVTMLFLLWEFKFRPGKMLLILAGGILVMGALFNAVGYSFEMLTDVFTTTRENVIEGEDAGTSMRFGMIANGLSYVVSNYIVLGIGLDWIPIEDPDMYNYLQFAATPTLDNGYYNIIIVFGLVGVFVFLNMLLRLFVSAWRSKKISANNTTLKVMTTGVFYYFIYNTLVSLGGDRFLLDIVFPITVGIILMNEKILIFDSQYILLKKK